MSEYFARTKEDIEFDNTIRDSVKSSKSRSHMGLFLQGQEQLNLLRHLVENQEQMREDLDALHILIDKAPELHEKYEVCITEDEAYNMVMDELATVRRSIDDLLVHILEAEDDDLDEKFYEMHNDAESLVRISAERAKLRAFRNEESVKDRCESILWDYILSCLEYCKSEYESASR